MGSWYMFKTGSLLLQGEAGGEDERPWERGCPCSALLPPRELDRFYLFFRLTSRVVMIDVLM